MYEVYYRGLYHLLSSGSVGLLAWLLMYSTYSPFSSPARGGSTSSISWSQLRVPLLLAVWTHIIADIVEHGGPPEVVAGITGLLRFLLG